MKKGMVRILGQEVRIGTKKHAILVHQVKIFKQKLNPHYENLLEQAKEMEAKQRLEHQLFIGKVTCIIGFDKTLELLKESKLKTL